MLQCSRIFSNNGPSQNCLNEYKIHTKPFYYYSVKNNSTYLYFNFIFMFISPNKENNYKAI